MNQDLNDGGGISEKANPVHPNGENSSKLVDESALETVIVIKSDDEHVDDSVRRANEDSNELNEKVVKEKDSCAVDLKCGSNFEGERVCRICHLNSEKPLESTNAAINETDLIQLGCDCKAELGIAHSHCAETWFKLKGNRFCEICGETAKNITGGGDEGFIEEWNENGSNGDGHSPESSSRCCQRQPFCNLLLACLVIAFVLPWFFRVNMF